MSALIGPPDVMDCGTGLALYTISGHRAGAPAAIATLQQIDELHCSASR